MPRDERAAVLAKWRGELAPPPPEVDDCEALRTMGLRLQLFDLSTPGAIRIALKERAAGVGWRADVTVRGTDRELSAAADEIELRIKSDAGALELAGHSIAGGPSSARPSCQISPSSFPFRSPATWIAEAATGAGALRSIRQAMVLALETRIANGIAELREAGREFDLGAGWTPAGPLVFTVPSEADGDPIFELLLPKGSCR